MIIRFLAAAAAAAVLASCQASMPPSPSRPAAPKPAPSDLVFGTHWIGRASQDFVAQNISRTAGLPNVVPLANELASSGVDVIVRLTYMGSYIRIETFSGAGRKPLTEGRASWFTQAAGWRDIGKHLIENFPAGSALYEARVAERPSPAGAGGVTKDDLAAAIKQAVAAAGAPSAAPPAAAPKSEVDAPAYKVAERPDDYAVVIGIEKYSDLPEATFAERDAESMRAHLAALGVPERNIVSLIGSKAGKAAFIKTFETWLPRNAGPDSTVWVYYSGHGAPDARSGEAHLLPWDGDPQFLDDTGYPLKRLYAKLGALPAKRVIVAVDSCFSGAGGRSVVAKGTRPLVTKVDLGAPGRVIALTASASDQISGTAAEKGHGLFTYHLLAGLNGGAADAKGHVSLAGLFGYLEPRVRDSARRANRDQAPQLVSGNGAAEAILLR